MSFRTVTKPHMKKTVVTTVRARPVFWGAVPVAVLVVGTFMGSRASITDFAGQKGEDAYSQRGATIGPLSPPPAPASSTPEFPPRSAPPRCWRISSGRPASRDKFRVLWHKLLMTPRASQRMMKMCAAFVGQPILAVAGFQPAFCRARRLAHDPKAA